MYIHVHKHKNHGGGSHTVYLRLYKNDIFYTADRKKLEDDAQIEAVKAKLDRPELVGKLRDKKSDITIIPRKRIWETREFHEKGIETKGITILSMHSHNSGKKLMKYSFVPAGNEDKENFQALSEILEEATSP
uniref:Uncharacterized protein n=1 Tax=Lotharella oceanica TaxID=641309 RepID=A0A7S2TKP3_9EUKA